MIVWVRLITRNIERVCFFHILVWLDSDFKDHTATDVDSIISAEIPNKLADPQCYDLVAHFMIHGPCGNANPNNSCMKSNQCSKYFPKKFRSEITFDSKGFVYYKHCNDPTAYVMKNGVRLDNSFVVPYNRELLLRYQAHINVEICCQSMVVKYLFKYVSKGSDRARASIGTEDGDEIMAHINCRFIGRYEAVWRLFEFPITLESLQLKD